MNATFLPDWATFLQFSAAAFVLTATPGPDMTLFVGRSISEGRLAGFACMFGALCGIVVHTTLVALGLSALIVASPEAFLVLKVAIPAALPHVFVGLFMGLGSSFAVLVVAEMIGVKAGLGWYLQWAQGWAAYANMYAALIVMSLLCSGAITLLFKIRDRLLVWQKGVVKW